MSAIGEAFRRLAGRALTRNWVTAAALLALAGVIPMAIGVG